MRRGASWGIGPLIVWLARSLADAVENFREFRRYSLVLEEVLQDMAENMTLSEILEALEAGKTLTREQVRPLEAAIAEAIGYEGWPPEFLAADGEWAIVEKWMVGQGWKIAYNYFPDLFIWGVGLNPINTPSQPFITIANHPHRLTAACLAFARARGLYP